MPGRVLFCSVTALHTTFLGEVQPRKREREFIARIGVAHRLELQLGPDKNQDPLGMHLAGAGPPLVRSL